MKQLPEDWRYSLSARVKKEYRKDREEMEQENFRAASIISREAMTRAVVSFVIKIDIQALVAEQTLASWTVNTVLAPSQEGVVFEVPSTELRAIPFCEGITVRLLPIAYSNVLVSMMTPSPWFIMSGSERSSERFQIEFNEAKKFKSIKLILQEEEFSKLIVDAYFAYNEVNNDTQT